MRNITQPPIGIMVTMGKEVLEANGGAKTAICETHPKDSAKVVKNIPEKL